MPAALIEASIQLFADRLPNQVPVREIAALANVNQGLVHEYFGSKDGLITATIHRLSEIRAATMEPAQSGSSSAFPTSARIASEGRVGRSGASQARAHLRLSSRAVPRPGRAAEPGATLTERLLCRPVMLLTNYF
jgi:AcrR family transcriptional regulator